MGRAKRWKPKNLHRKLKAARIGMGLSQSEMIAALRLGNRVTQQDLSAFEKGLREPPLPVLLRYARLAHLPVEVLIDDRLDLPK